MTQDKKLSIEELAQEVNQELMKTAVAITDARHASVISPRRIRDYITKGLLDKPFGKGHNKWFGQSHLEKLVAIRQLQSEGLSDQYMMKLTNSDSVATIADDEQLRSGAMSFLNNLHTPSNIQAISFSASSLSPLSAMSSTKSMSAKSLSESVVQSYYSATASAPLEAMKKQINKVWNEYQLDDEGKIFLKVESNTKIKNPDQMLEQIKSIIGEKND